MSKKKGRPGPGPSGGKKQNPVALLLKEHSELSRDEAQQIVDAGISYEEWRAEQERKREERRRANQERIVAMICSQHPDLSREQAHEIVNRGITPETYKEELRQKQREARRQQSRPPQSQQGRGFQKKFAGKPGGKSGGGPRGGPRKGGKPKAKKWDKAKASKKKEIRKQAVDEILVKYPDLTDRAVAGQIASGHLTYEQWLTNKTLPKAKRVRSGLRTQEEHTVARQLREERSKKLQDRVEKESHLGKNGDTFLSTCIESKELLRILRFHRPHFVGTIIGIEPFRLFFQTDTNPNMPLTKRFCSALLKEKDWDNVASQMFVSLSQRALQQVPHHEPTMRYLVPDDMLVESNNLSVMLHEGLFFSGTVFWSDRFQFLLSLPQGGEVFVFRHGVHRVAPNPTDWQTEAMPYHEFVAQNPQLPQVHPTHLSIEDIFVPVHFHDYPVKDQTFERYVATYNRGDFQFDPLLVRREGDMYVLVDGFRRLCLAKEVGVSQVPILVTL